ncbi:hypothetical protein MTP04_22570 [Lysinibacillus sp. PLM2]|nr:hypothetical protein MTP04_22570 [Lysinibacillus sp. PLM2]
MTIEEHIIANDVLRNVMDKFKNQQVKGLAKYGETVNPKSYDVVGWINHRQQEAIDSIVYDEVLIKVISEIVEENKKLKEQLQAKVILVNNGWEEERYALQEEVIKYREALEKIATRKMSCYLSESHMNQDFIKIANEALEESKMKDLNHLTYLITEWATIKDLDTAQPEKQMLKLVEEVGELAQGLAKGNLDQVVDSIGDVYVVLTILAMQMDLDIKDCIYQAYEEIKNRKGKTVNGVFIKESDLIG